MKNYLNFIIKLKFVFFPILAKEGILTTMLESSSSGIPVITTNCCGMIEFLKHRKNGIFVGPNNSDSLAKAIKLLLENETLKNQLGINVHEDIIKN